MKRGKTVITLISLLVLSCGQQQQQLKVTFLSDPPGGMLYRQNGESWGPCPKVLWYDLSEEVLAAGKLQAKGLVVRWPSGPEKRSDDTITFQIDGSDKQFTFVQFSEAKSDQQTPDAYIEIVAIDRSADEDDTGLREEPDEPNVPVTRTVKTEEPIDDNVVEQVDDARQNPRQDPELRDEPDERTVLIAEAYTAENRSEGIIEIPSNANQIRSESDTGIREEPEGTQTERIETAVTVDPARTVKPEIAEDPNKEAIQVKVRTKEEDIGDGVLMKFSLIPSGEFFMTLGIGETVGDSNQSPTQTILKIRSFYMGQCEVTQEQYEKIMRVNPARFEEDPNHPNRPVETVSWYDAEAFCKKLSTKLKVTCRLPTEAEWEYACRAGTKTTYYWGDDFDSRYARTIVDRESGTDNVRAREPNGWDLYDMSGNVWEWCDDWYGQKENFRILRGGSWGNSPRYCRSAHRNWHTPNHRYDDCGFRVVMDVESASK